MYTIITVDDEPVTRIAINNYIGKTLPQFQISATFSNGLDALEYLRRNPVDIVITDILMPKMDGLELAEHIHREFSSVMVCIISGYGEFGYAQRAMRYGVEDYLLKPLDFEELSKRLAEAEKKLSLKKAEQMTDLPDSDDLRIQQAKAYIQAHYSEDLSRKEVANMVYLSPAYFSRLFTEKTGESFISYLTNVRMQKAAQLLATSESIEDIAKKVGYQSRNRFAINFREFSGCTPAEYRRYNLRSKELTDHEES